MNWKILVIDDEEMLAELLSDYFSAIKIKKHKGNNLNRLLP